MKKTKEEPVMTAIYRECYASMVSCVAGFGS